MDPAPPPAAPDDGGSSRRTFIAGTGAAAVLGAAAVTLVAAGPAAASADASAPGGEASQPSADPVVAYLRDPAASEVRLLTGEREVVVHDRALARALARHAAHRER